MLRQILLAMLFVIGVAGNAAAAAKPRLREPVAIAISGDGKQLFTANRRSGTVSVLEIAKRSVVREIELGGRLTALTTTAGGKRLLVTDERNHQLVLLAGRSIAERLQVAEYPVDVVASQDGRRCYVSSLWSRTVSIINLAGAGKSKLQIAATIRLPFAPGKLCLGRDDSRLIVAGTFAGKLAVIDVKRPALVAVKELPGHNIRGLAITADGKRLLTVQQSLNPLARSTLDDVHWGNMLVNVLYSFSIRDVCDPQADLLKDRRMTHLGAPENGAGDPGAIAVGKKRVAIALSGVHEIAVAQNLTDPLRRIAVGKRPAALAISHNGERLFVADQFSDTVSIINAKNARRIAAVSLGSSRKLSPAERGERLFFDAKLSHDGWMSCHSCHTNGHTNGLRNDNLSDGSFGAPKRVLSLLGVAQTAPWAWNGNVNTLEQQVRNSIQKTMRGKSLAKESVSDLVAYLKTLESPPPISRYDKKRNRTSIKTGRQLFQKLNCNRCHAPPNFTSVKTYDVGLKDAAGNTRFNPPSLRGVGRRPTLFHDGRANSLKTVFTRDKHQLPRALTNQERDALIAFLRSL